MNAETEFNVVDLFSGAGGLSEGFFRAGYRFLAHIEMDRDASRTLEIRSAYHTAMKNKMSSLYGAYITNDISRHEFLKETEKLSIHGAVLNYEIKKDNENKIINIIKSYMRDNAVDNVDVIIGGPPCQAYSIVGRSRVGEDIKKDPRNFLFLRYITFLKAFRPKIFIFENVPGIKTALDGKIYPKFVELSDRIGYTVHQRILDASDFGVLQRRKRIIIIGWKKEARLEYPDFEREKHKYLVSSILDDLPPLQPGEGTDDPQEYATAPTAYLREYDIRGNNDILTHHVARMHNKRDREIYRIAIQVWNSEKRRIKYEELPDYLKTHRNKTAFQDRFKVIAGDLPVSHTLTAHISKDGHHFIHPDIKQARSITVREAARIQSFPDNFIFEGSRTSKFRQIGNAVPPLMSEKIALKIKEMMEDF